jgi:pimeloyl-ACP methyl ester carboxylesterase
LKPMFVVVVIAIAIVPLAQVGAQTCDGLSVTIAGTAGDDDLVGTMGADVIAGLGGNDRIKGLEGDDVICGGAGDDDLLGDEGADRLFGDAGNDTMEGGVDDDRCDGVAGIDSAGLDCEIRRNVDTEIVPVTLFAPDGFQLDGALYIPVADAAEQGTREVAMLISHGAMGSFDSSIPKTLALQAAPLGFPVLALNRRDWGPTGGGGKVLFPHAVLDLGVGIDLLNLLGYENVYVAGHSQGTQNAAIYPSFTRDGRVSAVGLYGTVDDGRRTATEILFPGSYEMDVLRAKGLMSSGAPNEVVPWLTFFGVDLFRSPANFLSFWGPDTLSVVEREIAKLTIPALLLRAAGDEFTPDMMSRNVIAAADAAGVDATYIVLDYPFPLTDLGGNAHGFVAGERETMQTTLDWLLDKVPAASMTTTTTRLANLNPPGNIEPIADAGEEQLVVEGWTVPLDSSASIDLDGTLVSASWSQVSGETAVLSDANMPKASVTIPTLLRAQDRLVFEVTVTDDDGGTDSARVEMQALKKDAVIGTGGGNGLAPLVVIVLLWFGIRRRNSSASRSGTVGTIH